MPTAMPVRSATTALAIPVSTATVAITANADTAENATRQVPATMRPMYATGTATGGRRTASAAHSITTAGATTAMTATAATPGSADTAGNAMPRERDMTPKTCARGAATGPRRTDRNALFQTNATLIYAPRESAAARHAPRSVRRMDTRLR